MEHSTNQWYQYTFPLDAIKLKDCRSNKSVEAEVLQITRWIAYRRIHSSWRRFQGPFAPGHQEMEDAHWRWVTFVRKFRRDPLTRCAGLRTGDGHIQGAIIYRRDGASWLDPGDGAVHGEYLAAAPWNREKYAAEPAYRGVGTGLVTLAMLQSYQWGMGGRMTLWSLPGATFLYERLKFVRAGLDVNGMIPYEVAPEVATDHLASKGLI